MVDIRLLAQRDIVLDPQAEMLEVTSLPHVAKHQQSPAQDVLFLFIGCLIFVSMKFDSTSIQPPLQAIAVLKADSQWHKGGMTCLSQYGGGSIWTGL